VDIPGIKDRTVNGFNFRGDPDGRVCPIGAHIRRANPRTGDYPTGRTGLIKKLLTLFGLTGTPEQDRIATTRFHRILRRGREYGMPLDRLEAVKPNAQDPQSGLHFLCLNANLSRQFEFVQGAWLANAKFAGMSNEQDPLLGNRAPFPGTQVNDRFTRPHADGPCRVSGAVPQFITVRGGAYFFLPGLRALNWLLADR
jgi:deferrochelatase/peroxidase EfeB